MLHAIICLEWKYAGNFPNPSEAFIFRYCRSFNNWGQSCARGRLRLKGTFGITWSWTIQVCWICWIFLSIFWTAFQAFWHFYCISCIIDTCGTPIRNAISYLVSLAMIMQFSIVSFKWKNTLFISIGSTFAIKISLRFSLVCYFKFTRSWAWTIIYNFIF